jgi:hypothetical protein
MSEESRTPDGPAARNGAAGGRVHLMGTARPKSYSVGPFSTAIAKV